MPLIILSREVLGSIRVAINPLWEALASLMLVTHTDLTAPWPYTNWVGAARPKGPLPDDDWFAEVSRFGLPAFVMLPPTTPRPTLAQELTTLVSVPHDTIRAELARRPPHETPPALRRFGTDPEGCLHRLANAISEHWRVAIEPVWPLVSSALDGEILVRGRTMATEGPEALLSALPGRLRWHAPELRVVSRVDSRRLVCTRRLTLVPLVFGRGLSVPAIDVRGSITLSYQARGATVLARAQLPKVVNPISGPVRVDPLSTLIGRGRASVIRALVVPTTTTALAKSLGLAASTVSEHLATLVATGVVKRRRSGGSVLYELDHSGIALLGLS